MKQIVLHPSHISITDYAMGDCKELENAYTYQENWRTYSVGLTYDEPTRELRLSGGSPKHLRYMTEGLPIVPEYRHDPYEKISLRLQNFPRNQLQSTMIQFLIGAGEYSYNKNCTQLACNADTGEGKTFCAIAMMTYLGMKTIIILNRLVIEDIWVSEITKFTDIDERRILRLNTHNIHQILNDGLDPSEYDIFVCIHRTIGNLGRDYGWEMVHRLFLKLGIGLKLYDEAHREFANTTMVDCYTNTKKTVYLTATLKLSSPQANRIYQYIFRDIPKFDQHVLGYNDAKRHIVGIAFIYNSHPGIDAIKKCYNARMHYFNAKSHSMYQINDDTIFFELLESVLTKMTITNKFRTLILVSRILACDEIADFIQEHHKGLAVGTYNSSVAKDKKQEVLDTCDVIVSTNSSLGESVTIPKLQCVLNCEAHRNYGDQASGRLRKFKENPNTVCYYCEMVDIGFRSILSQWNSRKRHYAKIFRDVIEIKV